MEGRAAAITLSEQREDFLNLNKRARPCKQGSKINLKYIDRENRKGHPHIIYIMAMKTYSHEQKVVEWLQQHHFSGV